MRCGAVLRMAVPCVTSFATVACAAVMASTYRSVHEKAQLEWRLLVARHVLKLEVLGIALLGERAQPLLLAGRKSTVDNK